MHTFIVLRIGRRTPAVIVCSMRPAKITRRLFRETDDFDPKRRRGKVTPDKEDIPAKYQPLLDWYSEKFAGKRKGSMETDPILGLRGLGKENSGRRRAR